MIIDLRSDTVTRPCAGMLEAMMTAKVGDDVLGDDPTVKKLERLGADLFGFEEAIFCPSGTQTNQVAIAVHCRPGDEVICHNDAHIYRFEAGGIARNAGASVRLLHGNQGRIKSEDIEEEINRLDVHNPRTSLIAIEDTTNKGGGAYYNIQEIKSIGAIARENRLKFHLDGARVFNGLVETGYGYKDYANNFDSVSICLSKGLGAPVGSLLLGSKDFIKEAIFARKVFGGGMRQAGFLAAAGIFALNNNIARLKEDNENAKLIGEWLLNTNWVKELTPIHTNIVIAQINDDLDVSKVVEWLRSNNIDCFAFGPKAIRFVTHKDVTSDMMNELSTKLTLKY